MSDHERRLTLVPAEPDTVPARQVFGPLIARDRREREDDA